MYPFRSGLLLLCVTVASAFAEPAVGGAATATAASGHDLYICATFNKGYVTGSKITTVSGLFRRDGKGEWQHLGNNDLKILGVAFDPRDPNVIYTAAHTGSWRSLDGGRLWRLTTTWDMTEGRDVAVDPNAPDHVYFGLPDGLAVSENRGDTWVRRENGLPERGKYTQTIEVDRTKAGRVFAGCESGIYLSENGGGSWRRVLPTKTTVDDLQQSPHDPQLWVAATQSDGAWSSHDGGVTWKKFAGVPSDHPLYNVTFDATHPNRIALGGWHYGVLTTEDGGATWTDRNAGLPTPHRVARVAVDPDSGRLYASVISDALYTSDDFGRTWTRSGLEGSIINCFVFRPKAAK